MKYPQLFAYDKAIDSLADEGYAIIDGFLSPVETEWLRLETIRRFTDDRFKRAGIGHLDSYQRDKSIRGDYIHWIDRTNIGQEGQFFFAKLDNLIQFVNRTCYLGLKEAELHFAVYPPGAFYKRHLDTFKDDDARKLSVICYLNEPDWKESDGGMLRLFLPQNGQAEKEVDIMPVGGRLVCFRSDMLEHEVLVAHRERFSATGWLRNEIRFF